MPNVFPVNAWIRMPLAQSGTNPQPTHQLDPEQRPPAPGHTPLTAVGPPDDWASLPKHAQDWLTRIEHSSVPKPEKKEPPPPPAAILFAAWTPDWEARALARAGGARNVRMFSTETTDSATLPSHSDQSPCPSG